jgi:hypothetical protein
MPATLTPNGASHARTAPLRPLLVSGRGLRCAEQDADALLAALAAAAGTDAVGAWSPAQATSRCARSPGSFPARPHLTAAG